MNHHLLYASTCGMPPLLPWQTDLASRGIVVLRAGRIEEALPYCGAYEMTMILLDIPAVTEEVLGAARRIKEACEKKGRLAPLIGHCHAPVTDEERTALADAGVDDLVHEDDPPRFILWRLETLTALDDLRRFEKSRMDVANLASKTRECLHDLSQPLSAVQGRLQLMAAKLPSDDPSSPQIKDLVRLILAVSQQVMEIHQIHRQYS